MCKIPKFSSALAAFAVAIAMVMAVTPATAQKKVVIGATGNIYGWNPYQDSAAQMYGIWCNVYGCLCRYDFDKANYSPMLAESWSINPKDRNEWTFKLRKDVKSHSGADLTAADVVHTINRIKTDKQSSQKQNVRPLKTAIAVDKHTVKLITKIPTAHLLQHVCDIYAITRKAVFDKHGSRNADRKHPDGFGPYKLDRVVIGEQVITRKAKNSVFGNKDNPDILIWRKMTEVEQRVTALLNGEIQIAQFIPPHLMKRVDDGKNTKLSFTDSVEIMMLLMNPAFKPWDNKKLRKAVAHAIDREKIIKTILQGMAQKLKGSIGPGQIGYDAARSQAFDLKYDPELAKKLVKEAGFPNGVDVEMSTPVGRYVNDKIISQAIVPMLAKVGIRAKLLTPEWSTQWANVRKGKRSFFYQGRGSVIDPGPALAQYFKTGVSPRIKYSNPKYDALFDKVAQEFDPKKRQKLINDAIKILVDDVPAVFMWRHKLAYGVANNVSISPPANGRIYGENIRIK
ncbi:MAG: peptide ABC transporter substrate-binding protein [Rhodospirillaceae bacterium]|nr:peptide ABC transporter substrate-binding protein [Rhodospirillaceae bacterium]|tara:strand:- start:13171 stop:14703 length:1533 start_codon:yes stop_codon:yes gene_type:complete